MNENVKNNGKFLSIGLSLLLILAFGVSYAYYQVTLTSKNDINVTAGTLTTSFNEGKAISLANSEPMKDADGLTTNGYTFTLNNTGDIPLSYNVYLNITSHTLPLSSIKFSISDGDAYMSPVLLSSYTLDNNRINIKSGTLEAGGSQKYTIKLWIDEGADSSTYSKDFNANISVESTKTNVK